ncbi:ribonuclease E inhibitor RraB [Myxococcota bacterium]|nr:ribonuclease E inhibitor RraB [Myxococcota bacterium]
MILALLLACASPVPQAPPAPPPEVTVQVSPDADLLARLGIPGPGEGRAHRLQHELSFPSPEGADAAAVALSAQGLAVSAGAEGEVWLLTAEETVDLTQAEAQSRRAAMEALAQGYGGLYDGFSAEVMP